LGVLSGQDLYDISIPFQIYFIQATTTRFLTREAAINQFLVRKLREYNLTTVFITTTKLLVPTVVDHP
jgi:hypothetical protein